MTAATPAATAIADAALAACSFGHDLYPENVVCTDAEQVSAAVRRGLGDGDERWPAERVTGFTYVVALATGQQWEVRPGTRRVAVDALLRACAPTQALCDGCTRGVGRVLGLLPVPAGACVVVLALCANCFGFITHAFPSSHFIDLQEN